MKTPPKTSTTLRWTLLTVAVLLLIVIFYGPNAWALAVPVLALAVLVSRRRRRRSRRRAHRRPERGQDVDSTGAPAAR